MSFTLTVFMQVNLEWLQLIWARKLISKMKFCLLKLNVGIASKLGFCQPTSIFSLKSVKIFMYPISFVFW